MREKQPVPQKLWHLRPRTKRLLSELGFYDPRHDRFGSLASPEKGLTGEIYTSIAYTFKSAEEAAKIFSGAKMGFAYPRISCGTPPIVELSQKLLLLELGKKAGKGDYDVLLAASGMSAITVLVLALAEDKKEFISSPYLYGGTHHLFANFLPKLGITCHMISNPLDLKDWEQAARRHRNATFLYAEDDANPTPIKLDNAAIARIAHRHKMLYVCDRTIGTPVLERPLLAGTDVVVHSLSKNIGGHSRGLGGAIIAKRDLIQKIRDTWFPVLGPVMDARVADYMLWGIRNLERRMREKVKNTRRVAKFLSTYPGVKKVYGPGGDLLAFEVFGTLRDARKIVESVELILFAPHLGDLRSLIIHPASTTHAQVGPEEREKLGISDTLIRLSVGLEDPQDIIDDLRQAFAKIRYRHIS